MLTKKEQRLRRARQTRIRIAQQGAVRLTVNRTNLHIYATLISDDGKSVLASASALAPALAPSSTNQPRCVHTTTTMRPATCASRMTRGGPSTWST